VPALHLTEADWLAIEREACRRSLATFVQRAWHVLEPGTPYVHGWHIDAICDHLEAVTAGEINRLLINIPPGTMKSTLAGVFWPAWEWGPAGLPHLRIIGASHEAGLATRDARKMRMLVTSDWYQALWPLALAADQSEKVNFENAATGFRQASPVRSMTGKRGHRVVWDDPHSVEGGNSEADRVEAVRIFRETLPTRVLDPATSAIIVVMQRLHEKDVSGEILSGDYGYTHLCLPMEFDPARRCRTSIGFEDPRTQPGELLFPERFPREVVERDKRVMGAYAVAGQFQQQPAPRSGGMFQREDFEIVDAAPATPSRVRRWDFAATDPRKAKGGDPDYTVGLLMSEHRGIYYVEHVTRARKSPAGVETMLSNTASQDGRAVKIVIPQDPGAAGKSNAAHLIRMMAGYTIKAVIESGSKVDRARPVSAQAEAGNIKLVRGDWNEAFLEEVCMFPNGAHDDQVDALTGAFAELVTGSTYNLGAAL
jgi:predicted phage terminase large subunit-like protein